MRVWFLVLYVLSFGADNRVLVTSQMMEDNQNATTNSDSITFDDDSRYFVTELGPIHLWVEPTPVVLNSDEAVYVLDTVAEAMDSYMRTELDSYRFARFSQQYDIQISFNAGHGLPSRRNLIRNVNRNELQSRNPATVISIPGIKLIFGEEVPEEDATLKTKLSYAVALSFSAQYRTAVAMAVANIDSNFPWFVTISWEKDLPLTAPIIPPIINPEIGNNSTSYTLIGGLVIALLAVALFVGYRRRRNSIDRDFISSHIRLRTERGAMHELHGLDFLYEQGSKIGGFPTFHLEPWIGENEEQASHQKLKNHVGEQVIVPVDPSDVSSVTTDRSAFRFPLSIQDQDSFNLTRVQEDLYGETRLGFERLGRRPPSLLKGDVSVSSASDLSEGSEMGNFDAIEALSDSSSISKQDCFVNSPIIENLISKHSVNMTKIPVSCQDDDQSSVGDILRHVV